MDIKKEDEIILHHGLIKITATKKGSCIRIGIDAPKEIKIERKIDARKPVK